MATATPTTGNPQNNVAFTRAEVMSLKPRWDLIRECLSGDKAVKDKGELFLPKPNAADTSEENRKRYEQYKERAVFYNVTARTLKGMTGQVFARDPVLTIPDLMDVIEDDCDGGGLSLDQQSRKALGLVMAHGRSGLLVDYPKRDTPASAQELADGDVRPNICLYEPWDIINWRQVTIGGKKKLSLVVISERMVTDDDGYEAKLDSFFRVLRLYDGIYWSETWVWNPDINDYELTERIQPLDSTGKPWTEIPFTFIGSENNDPIPDLPPLYDMAVLNIAHYRNSADYEEACFIVGQPTPYFTGLTEDWVANVLKGQIQLGARAAVPLPENATAGLLQVEPNSMAKEAMEMKELQMVALGAKLVEQKAVQRTATEAGLDSAAETSLLATCAKNVSEAYTCALKWCAMFMGAPLPADEGSEEDEDGKTAEKDPNDICYELNTDFDISRLSFQDLQQLVASWQANAITFTEMRDNLKRGGIAYQDDEEAKTEMEQSGLDLGVPVGSPASAAAAQAKQAADLAKQTLAAKQTAGKPTPGAKPGQPTPPKK